jgi:hypothetical protein
MNNQIDNYYNFQFCDEGVLLDYQISLSGFNFSK